MKALRVVLRPSAEDDLEDIYHWIVEASGNPVVAARFIARLLASCERIGLAPHGGRPRDDLLSGLRTTPFERSVVITYLAGSEVVEIINLFHGGRDYDAFYRRSGDPRSS